jgi:hypothetical protein
MEYGDSTREGLSIIALAIFHSVYLKYLRLLVGLSFTEVSLWPSET